MWNLTTTPGVNEQLILLLLLLFLILLQIYLTAVALALLVMPTVNFEKLNFRAARRFPECAVRTLASIKSSSRLILVSLVAPSKRTEKKRALLV